jgi:DNA-binding MarR family transcriptional regulator
MRKAGANLANSAMKPVATSSRQTVYRDVAMLLYATTGRLNSLKRLIASSIGLNSAEYVIVAALHRLGPKGHRVKEIADYLHMAPENVTIAVGQLVQKKWVLKSIDPTDARAVTLRLHSSGKKRMDKLSQDLRVVSKVWFREMSGTELQSLAIFLERVLNGFDGGYQMAKEILQFEGRDERDWRITK